MNLKIASDVIQTELRNALGILPEKQKEMAVKRLTACNSCEHKKETFDKFGELNIKFDSCGICGCILNWKAKLQDQDCPHPEGSKWSEENLNKIL